MDWKEHPVIVALCAGAASMVFYAQVLQPIATKDKDNTIADQAKNIEGLNRTIGALNSKLGDARATADAANVRSEALRIRNRKLSQSRIFRDGTPYPIGFASIKLGTPVSVDVLRAAYPQCAVEVGKFEWYTVDCKKNAEFFATATYFYNADDKSHSTSHIALQYTNIGHDSEQTVVDQLQDLVGIDRVLKDPNTESEWWEVRNYNKISVRVTPVEFAIEIARASQ